MAKFKKNNYMFWHSPIALLMLFCFFVFFACNIVGLIEKQKDTSIKKEAMLEEIDRLKNKESDLNSKMSKLETEEGVEEIIRDKYQVTKEGEKMIVIVDDDRKKAEEDRVRVDHGFLGFIKNMFN